MTLPRFSRLRGDGTGPSAYLQAGVHADEIPGMLVLHRLLPRLLADEAAGRLRGDITIVPRCNPIGSKQFVQGRLLGRFDRATGHNFNRGFPDAAGKRGNIFAWQAALLRLTDGADIVLDLHTDDEALPYLYVHTALWPAASDLAACLGSAVAILWHEGGGGAFEDAVVSGWLGGKLKTRLCATIELRGQADVTDALADQDADALHRLLCLRGVVAGAAQAPAWTGEAIPLDHVETVRAAADGVIVYSAALGERLDAGAVFARLIPEPGDSTADILIRAPQAGMLFTRARDRYLRKGGVIGKLTGARPSANWADQPLDD